MGIAKTVKGNLTDADINAAGTYTDNIAPADGDTIASVPSTSTLLLTAASFWIGDGTQVDTVDVLTNNGRIKIDRAAGGQLRLKGQYSGNGTSGGLGQVEVTTGSTTLSAIKVDTGTGHVYKWRNGTAGSNTQCARLIVDNSANYATPANHWYLFEVIGTGSLWFNRQASGCGQIDLQGVYSTGKIDNGAAVSFDVGTLSTMTTQYVWRLKGVRWGSSTQVKVSIPPNGRDIYHYELVHQGTLTGGVSWNWAATTAIPALDAAAGGVRRIVDCAFPGTFTMKRMTGFTIGEAGKHVFFTSRPVLPDSTADASDCWAGNMYYALYTTDRVANLWMGSTKDGVFIYAPTSVSGQLSNPHGMDSNGVQDVTHDGTIWDATYVDGAGDAYFTLTNGFYLTTKNVILLTDVQGNAIGTCPTTNLNGHFRGEHCTYYAKGIAAGSAVFGEAGPAGTGTCQYWKRHLVITGTGAASTDGGFVMIDSGSGSANSANAIQGADYNAIEQVYTGAGVTTRVGPYNEYEEDTTGAYAAGTGTNDLAPLGSDGAKLVDRTANAAKFYRSVAGGGAAAEPADDFYALFTQWLKRGLPTYNAAYSIAAYRAYRQAKAKPTALALWTGAADDGLTRGAVQMDTPPTIALSSSGSPVAFAATVGGGNPSTKTVSVTNTGTSGEALTTLSVGTITYDQGAGWLTTASLGGATNAPATLTLGVTTGALAAGTYNAHVPIQSTATNVTNSPQTVDVQFVVSAGGSTITGVTVSPTTATLTPGQTSAHTATVLGTSPPTATSWTTTAAATAAVVSTGDHAATITAVAAGTCTVSAYAADGTHHGDVAVTVNATPVPAITVTTTDPAWAINYGMPSPSVVTRAITNGSATACTGLAASVTAWGAKEPTGWLTATTSATTVPANLVLTPDITGVGPRTLHATVSVTSNNGATTRTLSVTLQIVPQDRQAITPPLAVAERADGTAIDGVPLTFSVDLDDDVACDGTTGLCFAKLPENDPLVVTQTVTDGAGHSDTCTFKVLPDGTTA
jgi:hypothetical protein